MTADLGWPSGARSRLAAVLCCLAFCLWTVPLAGAEKHERKVVRVAYQEYNRQMVVDENNKPISGYAYDYVQTVGTYAGWEVKFVPCTSFFDSVRLLRAGKVDLIYEISYTEERAREFLFPNEPMGYEYYYLYSLAKNTSISSGDYSSMNGRTVGITSGTILPDLLRRWCGKRHVDLKFVEYENISEKEADLYVGKIDLDLEVSMLAKRDLSAIEKVGSSAYYLVARKDRPDLIDDLNTAVEKILNNDLYYFSRLQERYFADTVLSRNLTLGEKKWLAEHKVLRIGYFDNYLPLSARDGNGRPVGAGIEAIEMIIRELKLEDRLKVQFVCFDNQRDGYKAVESNRIDLMLPAYVSNSVKQDYAVIESKILAILATDLAYVNDFGQGKDKRIAVNRNNLMQYYYCREVYPKSEIVLYDNINGCLDALLKGAADATFLNGLRTEALLKPAKYHAIRTVRAKNDFTLRMAFAKDSIGLMLLMNRGLTMLDPDFVGKASYSYVGRMYTFSLMDFLQDHILSAIATVAILVALTVALIGYRISNRNLTGINRKLREHSETIEKQRLQLEKKQGELEDALRMAQSASRAKTAFLSNMSHDIRTPMNAIIGFTGLAAAHLDDKERVKEYLETITQSSEHLLSLINDVLDMSRIESGKMNLSEKEESLTEIVQTLREIVQADAKAKKLDLSIDAADIRDERVYCDKLRLNQILLNLLSNAIKYTPEGGRISLRIAQTQPANSGRATFEFRVRDNGIGMSEEFARTIFIPFTREENSTVRKIQGTGLGMAITKNIVDMMGGSISLNTRPNEGSEFVVRLKFRVAAAPAEARKPVGNAAAEAREPAPEEPVISLKGKKVLMVDDSELNLKIGVLVLQAQGLTVDTARNGRIAVDLIREKGVDAYDFIVMDIQMPVMDGYEATGELRKLPGGDKLKIIAFSANAFEEDKEKSLKAGMNGHITKPLKIDDLLNELKKFAG